MYPYGSVHNMCFVLSTAWDKGGEGAGLPSLFYPSLSVNLLLLVSLHSSRIIFLSIKSIWRFLIFLSQSHSLAPALFLFLLLSLPFFYNRSPHGSAILSLILCIRLLLYRVNIPGQSAVAVPSNKPTPAKVIVLYVFSCILLFFVTPSSTWSVHFLSDTLVTSLSVFIVSSCSKLQYMPQSLHHPVRKPHNTISLYFFLSTDCYAQPQGDAEEGHSSFLLTLAWTVVCWRLGGGEGHTHSSSLCLYPQPHQRFSCESRFIDLTWLFQYIFSAMPRESVYPSTYIY